MGKQVCRGGCAGPFPFVLRVVETLTVLLLHSLISRSRGSLLGLGGNVAVQRLPLFRHQPFTFRTEQFLSLNLCTPLAQKDGYCEEAIAGFATGISCRCNSGIVFLLQPIPSPPETGILDRLMSVFPAD